MTTKPAEPTARLVKQQLGKQYKFYEALLAAHPDLRPEWKYYGEKYGWSLKLFEKKRNLVFISTRDGELHIAFTFGDRQYEEVLKSDVAPDIKQQLSEARRYVEGRGLRLVVANAKDLQTVEQLLAIKRGATRS